MEKMMKYLGDIILRFVMALLLSVMLVACGTPSSSDSADSGEKNTTDPEVPEVPDGPTFPGAGISVTSITDLSRAQDASIATAGEEDWFSFSLASANTNLIIDTAGQVTTEGSLYDSSGKLLASASGDSSTPNFKLNPRNLAAGTYYLNVSGVNDSIGAYSVRVADESSLTLAVSALTIRSNAVGQASIIWTKPATPVGIASIEVRSQGLSANLAAAINTFSPDEDATKQAGPVSVTIDGLDEDPSYKFLVNLVYSNGFTSSNNFITGNSMDDGFIEILQPFLLPPVIKSVGSDAIGEISVTWDNPAQAFAIESLSINYTGYVSNNSIEAIPAATGGIELSDANGNASFIARVATDLNYTISGLSRARFYEIDLTFTYADNRSAASNTSERIAITLPDHFCPLAPDTTNANDQDGDGCPDDMDVDDDGDGLIEISTADELNMTRNNLRGSGLSANPGEVGNARGCKLLVDDVGTNYLATTCRGYELVADIDLGEDGYANWDPIGYCEDYAVCGGDSLSQLFDATFEGNGRVIRGLNIDKNDDSYGVGLFGAVAAGNEIRNIRLEANSIGHGPDYDLDSDFYQVSYVGALVGYGDGVIIKDVTANVEQIAGLDNVGGLLGQGLDAQIISSTATVGNLEALDEFAGGLVGDGQHSRVENSQARSTKIFAGFFGHAGGLLGGGQNSTIISSTAHSDTIEGDSYVGGLLGEGANARIESSQATTGILNASTGIVGGLIGNGVASNILRSVATSTKIVGDDFAGGLLGDGDDSTIESSYAKGVTIQGNTFVGGLVGKARNARLRAVASAVTTIRGYTRIGGLVGDAQDADIKDTTARVASIEGDAAVGGLVGFAANVTIASSYVTITRMAATMGHLGALAGTNGSYAIGDTEDDNLVDSSPLSVSASYWNEDELRTPDTRGLAPTTHGRGESNSTLYDTAGFSGIYTTWGDAHCDPNTGAYSDSQITGYVPVWDIGTTGEAPVLNCLLVSRDKQRDNLNNIVLPNRDLLPQDEDTTMIPQIPWNSEGQDIATASEVDWFELSLAIPVVNLRIESAGTTDVVVKLYDSEGNLLEQDDNSGAGSNFAIDVDLGAGNYYIRVSGIGGATGAYTLKLIPEALPLRNVRVADVSPGAATITWDNPVHPVNFTGIRIDYVGYDALDSQSELATGFVTLNASNSLTSLQQGAAISQIITGLDQARYYSFTLTLTYADDLGDVTAAPTTRIIIPPQSVTNFVASANPTPGHALLTWDNPASDYYTANIESITFSYRGYISATGDEVVPTSAAALIYDDTDIGNGITFIQSALDSEAAGVVNLNRARYYDFTMSVVYRGWNDRPTLSSERIAVRLPRPACAYAPISPQLGNINDLDGDGCLNDADVDADGDGLIEIRTAAQFNMLRNNLRGTGLTDRTGLNINSTGCPLVLPFSAQGALSCSGYELMNDIDLADYDSWQPIGTCGDGLSCNEQGDARFFQAIFEGNNHTISNLNINVTAHKHGVGLFGAVAEGAELRNLHIRGGRISSSANDPYEYVGGLVGWANLAKIVGSSVVLDEINGRTSVGGLVGDSASATIDNSSAQINVLTGDNHVGGLIGRATGGLLTDLSATIINMTGANDVGGLVGGADAGAIIINSSASSNKIIGGTSVGGLVGQAADVIISSSVAVTGKIQASQYAGGLVGSAPGSFIQGASAKSGEIRGLMSSADAVGTAGVGGLVGFGDDATILASSSLAKDLIGETAIGGLLGLGENAMIMHSYAVATNISAGVQAHIGGLVGGGDGFDYNGIQRDGPGSVANSYWDEDLLVNADADNNLGSAQPTTELQNTTDFNNIYEEWGNVYCHPLTGVYNIGEPDEEGFIQAWLLTPAGEYPALNCSPLSQQEQRAITTDALTTDANANGIADYFDQ